MLSSTDGTANDRAIRGAAVAMIVPSRFSMKNAPATRSARPVQTGRCLCLSCLDGSRLGFSSVAEALNIRAAEVSGLRPLPQRNTGTISAGRTLPDSPRTIIARTSPAVVSRVLRMLSTRPSATTTRRPVNSRTS